eukprot:119992-Chlamydomonas_euryale.AAC.1
MCACLGGRHTRVRRCRCRCLLRRRRHRIERCVRTRVAGCLLARRSEGIQAEPRLVQLRLLRLQQQAGALSAARNGRTYYNDNDNMMY